ncbi:MAG: flagellin [Eubacteriales bacterium]|nr:flagellin [Eubacteriales bacterium]
MRINHNISAQLANVSLKKADNRLTSSLHKLSTGYKINKAADDSAGMAISNKMRTQIRALDQASRNAADGDSVIQTAEGSLAEIASILQRIRELGVEAANDTYTLEDREAIQEEVDQMLSEIDRISSTTEFNGKGLLDGSSARTIMSNSLAVRPLSTSLEVTRGTYNLTVDTIAEPATLTYDFSGLSTVIINGNEFALSANEEDATAEIIAACDAMNIDAQGDLANLTLTTRATGSAQQIAINDEQPEYGKDATITLGDGEPGFDPVDKFSYIAVGGKVTIVGSDGFEMQLDVLKAQAGSEATVRVENAGYMELQIGANEHQTLNVDFAEVNCVCLGLRDSDGVDLINACSQHGATSMLDVLDDAILAVSAARSALGAYQNRLDATQNSLDISSENLTDAMSRIMDTDMASEMTNYTQLSVISQAATAMLSQANNRPQQIMSLLQS